MRHAIHAHWSVTSILFNGRRDAIGWMDVEGTKAKMGVALVGMGYHRRLD